MKTYSKKYLIIVLLLINLFSFYLLMDIQGDVDLAKGRVYIDLIQWQDNPGPYAFEVQLDVYYARNCLDSVQGDEGGRAYVTDAGYNSIQWPDPVVSSKCYGNNQNHGTNYYADTSYFRRGSTSSSDGIYIRILIKKYWSFFGNPIYDGYSVIKNYHFIDLNTDYTYNTGWVYSGNVKVYYTLDIIET